MLALRGAHRVLQADRPFAQVETTPATRDVVNFLRLFSYDCFAVVESCGFKPGCRNVLCFRNEAEVERKSAALSLALRVGSLHLASSDEDLALVASKFPVKAWA